MAAPSRTLALLQTVPGEPAPALQRRPVLPAACRHLWLCVGFPALALEVFNGGPSATAEGENISGASVGSDDLPVAIADGDDLPITIVEGDDLPVAIVEGDDTRTVVHAVNAAARRHGVRPKQKLNAAYALCPALQTQARNVARESQRLAQLALWAGQYTPWVTLVEPGALLLEVRGSLALFGGASALCTQVEHELGKHGHRCRIALAPTPLASLWLARAGQRVCLTDTAALAGKLSPLPLRCLQWPDKTIAALAGMGVRRLGELLRLPRDGFARRFGKQRLNELDRALGRAPDTRAAYKAPEQFCASLDMPAETDDMKLLLVAAQRLIGQLGAFLIARQSSVQCFWLRMFHNDVPATCLRVGMLEHCRDASRLQALLETRLDNVRLPAPVIALELKSGRIMTASACMPDLFRRGTSGDWSHLLENLCARLGMRAITGLSSVPEHRPESAWRYIEPTQVPADTPVMTATGTDRPLWLLPVPQPLRVNAGRPVCDGALTPESGPELIESGWWDGEDIRRDYFVARNPHGLRLWIYRERRAPHAWYLHGYFG